MRALKIWLFVMALIGLPVLMGFWIKNARSEPIKATKLFMYCKIGDKSFTTKRSLVFLVISKASPSDEVQNGVVGTPVAVLMVDLDGKAHLFVDKMPSCTESDGASS